MKLFCLALLSLFCLESLIEAMENEDRYLVTLVYKIVFANEALCESSIPCASMPYCDEGGDPFGESDWLPAAGMCFLNCDPTMHMCMVHTTTKAQRCKKYSMGCQRAIRKHLGWSSTIVSVYRPESATTPSIPQGILTHGIDNSLGEESQPLNFSLKARAVEQLGSNAMSTGPIASAPLPSDAYSSQEGSPSAAIVTLPSTSDFVWPDKQRMQGSSYSIESRPSYKSEPSQFEQPTAQPRPATDFDDVVKNVVAPSVVDNDASFIGRSLEYALPLPPSPEPSPPAFSPFYYTTTTTSPGIAPELEFVTKIMEPSVTHAQYHDGKENALQSDYGYASESVTDRGTSPVASRNRPFDTVEATASEWIVAPRRPYQNMRIVPSDNAMNLPDGSAVREFIENFAFGGARFEVNTQSPPLYQAVPINMVNKDATTRASYTTRNNFHNTTLRGKLFAEVEPDKARDHSKHCCEWSLNGLCDRHWQRVRRICPKSCGSLVCEDVEGLKSCTRVLDVDVEECFQMTRLTRYFGLRTAETEEERHSVINGILHQKHVRSRKRRKVKRRRPILEVLKDCFHNEESVAINHGVVALSREIHRILPYSLIILSSACCKTCRTTSVLRGC